MAKTQEQQNQSKEQEANQGKPKPENQSEETVNEVDAVGIFGLGLYVAVLCAFCLYGVVRVWSVGSDPHRSVGILKLTVSGGSEIRLILIAGFMGVLGSLIHVMTSLTTYFGNREFKKSWVIWYVLRPFVGVPLALIFYFVFRGNLLVTPSDAQTVNTFGVAGLSGLVGMFSKQAVDKLEDIFTNILKTNKDPRKDGLKKPKPEKDPQS